MRRFRDITFADFNTVALPKESRKSPSSGRKKRRLNLNTYKFHSLEDYVRTIKLFGCTDSFSAQLVSCYLSISSIPTSPVPWGELAHRVVKRLYVLTNRRDATKQIAKHYRREETTRRERFDASDMKESQEEIPSELHHHTSASKNRSVPLAAFVLENLETPPTRFILVTPFTRHPTDSKGFMQKLKGHLLNRLLERDFNGDDPQTFAEDELNSVWIANNVLGWKGRIVHRVRTKGSEEHHGFTTSYCTKSECDHGSNSLSISTG